MEVGNVTKAENVVTVDGVDEVVHSPPASGARLLLIIERPRLGTG